MKTAEKTRFDTRLSKEQKEFFEEATRLGGFRTLTEFVISSAQQKAQEIIERHYSIVESKRDRQIFFSTILNPPAPNERLKKAARRYKKQMAKK